MESIDRLIKVTKEKNNSPEKIESSYMDLMESLVRHLAVISVAAYKNHGSKDKRINNEIIRQLPLPSFGSWKNILIMLASSKNELFPELFFDNFLTVLKKKKIDNADINLAFSLVEQLVEFATSEQKVFEFNKN